MSVQRTNSARDGQQRPPLNRPFSTNNPFRNASHDSNIGRGDAGFNSWVERNQSQMSFSSDDEDGELFKPERPAAQRTNSGGAMPPPRSTDPFAQPVSRSSTGSKNGSNQNAASELPSYARNTSSNTDYYNSDEKSRRPSAPAAGSTPRTTGDLPPSYEEAAGPNKRTEYPREKQTSSTASKQYIEEHKTRVHREWPGDSKSSSSRSGTHRSTKDGEHRSRRPSEPSRHREHRSDRERSDRERKEHREHREHRHREHKSSSSRSKKEKDAKPAKNVDTIDKLDVTGLFGGAFHHDGPFDACTPHRNKDQKSAPVLAFPADGPNSSIRGNGPVNKDATLRYIQGREDEDDLYTTSVVGKTYARGSNGSESTLAAVKNDVDITAFDTNAKATPVHGQTTLGLGSSTFLDGAPAAQSAILEQADKQASGLNRKKSIRQRLKGETYVSPPAEYSKLNMPSNERTGSSERLQVENGGNSLLKRVKSLKVGRSRS